MGVAITLHLKCSILHNLLQEIMIVPWSSQACFIVCILWMIV